MNTKHQGKYIKTPAPAQLKEIKKIPLRRRITQFRRAVKRNRFYRWALCALTCAVVFSSGRIYQSSIDKEKYTEADNSAYYNAMKSALFQRIFLRF